MGTHLKLHATQLTPRNMKARVFYNNGHTNIISDSDITPEECKKNLKNIHTNITHNPSAPEKTAKLLTPHFMRFIYQNKHFYKVTYAP